MVAPHSTTMGVQGKGHFIEKCGNNVITMGAIVLSNIRASKKKRKAIATELNKGLAQLKNGTTLARQKHEQKKKLKRECLLKNHKYKDSK